LHDDGKPGESNGSVGEEDIIKLQSPKKLTCCTDFREALAHLVPSRLIEIESITGFEMTFNSEHDIMVGTDTLGFDAVAAERLNDIPDLNPSENVSLRLRPRRSPH
jgi:hypothetical protein